MAHIVGVFIIGIAVGIGIGYSTAMLIKRKKHSSLKKVD
jgi:predicted transporter